MSDQARPIYEFVALPFEEISDPSFLNPGASGEGVFQLTFHVFVGEYEHDDITFFYGTIDDAEIWAENNVAHYWGVAETKWEEDEQAWVAEGPRRGVRVGSIRHIDMLTCETADGGIRLMRLYK